MAFVFTSSCLNELSQKHVYTVSLSSLILPGFTIKSYILHDDSSQTPPIAWKCSMW